MIDKSTQYTAKILRFRFAENFVRNFIATSPDKYANMKPRMTEIIETKSRDIKISEFFIPLVNSKTNDPKITGIDIKKENLTASSLFMPNILAEDIVRPERETPGRMATAWLIPTIRATSQFIFLGFSFLSAYFSPIFLPAYSNIISTAAVIKRKKAA